MDVREARRGGVHLAAQAERLHAGRRRLIAGQVAAGQPQARLRPRPQHQRQRAAHPGGESTRDAGRQRARFKPRQVHLEPLVLPGQHNRDGRILHQQAFDAPARCGTVGGAQQGGEIPSSLPIARERNLHPGDRNRRDLAAARELARVAAYPQLVDRDERSRAVADLQLAHHQHGGGAEFEHRLAHTHGLGEPLGEHVLEQRTKPRILSLQGKPRQRRERNAQDQRNKQQATKTQHHGNPRFRPLILARPRGDRLRPPCDCPAALRPPAG